MTKATLSIAAAVALACSLDAFAADFCVDSADALRTALDAAAVNDEDDTIRLVQATYEGSFSFESAEARALVLLGGYTAGCAGRTLDPANTRLRGRDRWPVLIVEVADAPFTIEGISISGGFAGLVPHSGRGGGLRLVSAADIQVRNAILSNNRAALAGAGAYLTTVGTVTVSETIVEDNLADGLLIDASAVALSDNRFGDNLSRGVAITADGVAISGSTFTGNTAQGAWIRAASTTLDGNDFGSNLGGGADLASIATISGNTFTGNQSAGDGAGLLLDGGGDGPASILTNNRFIDNLAGPSGLGGGAYITGRVDVIITNNSFSGSSASTGGGLAIATAGPSRTRLYNNLFWNNAGQCADLWIHNRWPSRIVLKNNDFDQTPETGFCTLRAVPVDRSNLDAVDPLFADAELRLSPASPLIDAGNNGAPALPVVDMDGEARVQGQRVDIGADEHAPAL